MTGLSSACAPQQGKATPMFLGREHEERVICDLVAGAFGRGGALIVVGDPGIGKSTLAGLGRQFAVRQGLMVLAATGVPAESRLPFAGLHQLLRPLADDIDVLPGQLRDAIGSAFGKGGSSEPDRFLVAMAVTDLLAAAAARQPLLVLADDVHWLDAPSCDVLTFLARRVDSMPVVVLATTRDGYQVPLLDAGLPELRLGGLGDEAAGQLLDALAPELATAARSEILGISLGNPLALSELSRSAHHAAPRFRPGAPDAGAATVVTYRIEKAFAARWSELPEPARTVLVVGALNAGGTLAETLAAASVMGGSPATIDAVTPAVEARLVEVSRAGMRFRHPLVRSAIEYRAGLGQITAAHHALAAVLGDKPDRKAWHQAAAALGPDEDVAAELDAAASRAERRAAISVAVQALERAVELSVDPVSRNGRLLRAAQLSWELGQPAMVDQFARSVDQAGLDLHERARLALLQENIRIGRTESDDRLQYLVQLARDIKAAGEAGLAMELLMSAARRGWWANTDLKARLLISDTATELADGPLHPALLCVLAYATPEVHGALVRDRLGLLGGDTRLDAVQLTHVGIAASVLGAFGQSRELLAAAIPQLHSQGRLGLLVRALHHDACSALHTSHLPEASAACEEGQRAAADAGQPQWMALINACWAVVAAMRGDDAEAERLAGEAEQVFVTGSTGAAIGRGLAALGRRDYQAAYQHLMRLHDPADGACHYVMRMYHLGDLADAARHSGHREQARHLVAELTATATEEPGPLLQASLAFAAPLLAPDDDEEEAGRLFEAALAGDLRHWPFYHARLELEYGGWLRRHRQSARSRPYLRSARDTLDAIGARAWRDRADAELRASGEHLQSGAPQAGRFGQLTAQQQQVARLVLAGLSNREIGERLHVSHRTVGYHLYRMFPKLGITSRAELGTVLAEAGILAEPDAVG
jgi:DNA-binding CsgD family transcriptional regulator